ncbi:hypothetical protein EDD85DRAFT_953021 [Armillaria nabsnona]|nr:hypothetical protein EDD85DRAFT_953021 [Armillaria nabsnona]
MSSSTDQPDLSKRNALKDYNDELVVGSLYRPCHPRKTPPPIVRKKWGACSTSSWWTPHIHSSTKNSTLKFGWRTFIPWGFYLEVYDYVRPWTLWSTEDNAYRELGSLQGKTVPYYFGNHKLTMPSGEDAEPAHDTPDDLGDANDGYVDIKQMFKKTLLGVHAINKLGVGHNDIRPGNIIVTPSGDPVVFDFAMAGCEIESAMETLRSWRQGLCDIVAPSTTRKSISGLGTN